MFMGSWGLVEEALVEVLLLVWLVVVKTVVASLGGGAWVLAVLVRVVKVAGLAFMIVMSLKLFL